MKKGKRNQKFMRAESAILMAFFVDKGLPKPGVVARRAKISRSTFFRHHKTPYDMIIDYEKVIYSRYLGMIRNISGDKNARLKEIYLRMLIFINRNQQEIKLVLKYKNSQIFEKMIWRLKNKIHEEYDLPSNFEQFFGIYVKEIAGVLEGWGKQNFDISQIEAILKKILYLTDTLGERLKPILEKN